jgi:hypothetical protein
MKRVIFPLISLMIGFVFACFIVESFLRLLGIGYGSAPLVSDPILHHVHPRNYTFLSHAPNNEYGGFHVYYDHDRYSVSEAEWKTPAKKTNTSETPCKIAFLGDSFTEASQVPYEESFVGLIRSVTPCQVRNYGVSSYSPILYLTQWRHEVKSWHPSIVVVELYSNDMADDERYAKLAEFDEAGLPTAIPGPGNDAFTVALRNLYLVRLIRKVQLKVQWWLARDTKPISVVGGYVEEDPDITVLSAKLMTALAEKVEGSGARFVMFVVPSKYRLANRGSQWSGLEFSDKWKEWASENKHVFFVDLVHAFRHCSEQGSSPFFLEDIHFNSLGHKIVATTLCRSFEAKFGETCRNMDLGDRAISRDKGMGSG